MMSSHYLLVRRMRTINQELSPRPGTQLDFDGTDTDFRDAPIV